MTLVVGARAIDLIISEEIGSEALYSAKWQHPYWPGGESGVTVGIGYDLGQHSPAEIGADWQGYVSPPEVILLEKVAGLKEEDAAHAVRAGIFVTVPFSVAQKQFSQVTLPRYAAMTEDAIDNCERLSADAFGALVSITFNRGAGGWNNDANPRFQEMYDIGTLMSDGHFEHIPGLIHAMQRLWPVDSGLWKRREKEAALFELAMKGN